MAIGRATLTDLPLLVTGAEIGLEAGDNVLVMYLGNTCLIVGKVATPGGPNFGASNAGHAGALSNFFNFGINTAGVIVNTITSITVPQWAHSVQLTMMGTASLHNNSGGLDNIASQVRVSCPGQPDHFSASTPCAVSSTYVGSTFALYTNVVPVTPGAALRLTQTVFSSGNTWPADSSAVSTLFVQAQFYREAA